MPSALTYPGVYIEELPSGVRTITGVATSLAAFVGFTPKGTPDVALRITSFADYERIYGGLHADSPLSFAVRQFFTNGGTEAYIVRVASGYASAQWQLADAGGTVLDVVAASPGLWANALRLDVVHADARNPDAEFNLVVSQQVDQGGTPQLVPLETHRNLNLNPRSANYAPAVVNGASQNVRMTANGALAFANAGFAVSRSIVFPLSVGDNTLAGTVDGDTPFSLSLAATPADLATLISDLNAAIAAAGLAARLLAEESGPDGDTAGNGCLRVASLATGASSTVTAASGAFGGLAAAIGFGLANGGRSFSGDAQHRPSVVAALAPASLGADGGRGGALELIGSPAAKTGMYALRDVDLFNLLCIPETRDLPEAEGDPVIQAAISLCEQERAFCIVDAPAGRTLANVAAWAGGVSQSRNAAVYFPALVAADPLDGFRQRPMAPSGAIAGIYARTDATRGVWKAPAGTDANINGIAGLSAPMNDLENGSINPLGVNALRNFPVHGRVVWGARTMRGADAQADEYKYVPVRRLALFLEESLYRGTQWVVFEPNDEPLWAQIRLNLGAFMQNLFRQGAFQGSSPRQAYFVKCDSESTTQNDINLGIVNIIVGFAPLKPAEFVVIKIQQMAGQVDV